MAKTEVIPNIKTVSELQEHLQPVYVLDSYMSSYDVYNEFFEKIYTLLKGCFERKDCREYPIRFQFYATDTKGYSLQLRHFIINLILWYPFVSVHKIKFLDETFIMDCTKIIADPEYDLDDWINYRIIVILRNFNVRKATIDESLSVVTNRLRNISLDFSVIMNLNFSFFTFKDAYENIPRIKELMEYKFPSTMQPREIEQTIDAHLKEEIEIYKSIPGNPLGIILNAHTGMKDKQFGEFTLHQGFKPTIDGDIMTIPIENSTLIGGLDRPSYIYIDAAAARKSLILNKTIMGIAGNFGKLVMQLAMTLELSKTITNCGTKHLVHIKVRDKKMLKKLNGRYYKLSENEDLRAINGKDDKFLIGKEIQMRSPVTCCLGNEVCAVCFGRSAGLNYDIAKGISGFESEEITKQLEQNILSSKHLLSTKSEILKFNEDFDKFFTLTAGEVYPNVENNDDVPNINEYAIYIAPGTMEKVDEMDEDTSFNNYIVGGLFYVVHMPTGDMTEIRLENKGKEIFITTEAIQLMKKGKGYIKFKELEDDMELFEMSILNDELTKPLYDIMNLLNHNQTNPEYLTVDGLTQRFLDLLCISGITATSLAGEAILNRLIRSKAHPYNRPDFGRKEVEPYDVITVRKALEDNESPALGLSVQYVKRQILSDEIVTERFASSYIDSFMMTEVPNLYEKYGKLKKEKRTPHPAS